MAVLKVHNNAVCIALAEGENVAFTHPICSRAFFAMLPPLSNADMSFAKVDKCPRVRGQL